MITLLHGDNVEASRAEFAAIVAKIGKADIRRIDGKSVSETQVLQAVDSDSLFGETPAIIIENLFSPIVKKPTLLLAYISLLLKNPRAHILLWEPKELSKTTIAKFGPSVRVHLFSMPVVIFQLLDGLQPGKSSHTLPIYNQTLKTEAPELILAMVSRRFHQLIMLRDGVKPEGLAPWQASRLTSQANSFSMEQLCAAYAHLVEMEYSFKSGNVPLSLEKNLELFFIKEDI